MMNANKLKLNDDKTEAIRFSTPTLDRVNQTPNMFPLGPCEVPFSKKVRDLGFTLDSDMTMKQHIIRVCQAGYAELKRISSICQFLTEEATKTLVTSCILSRLDYSNSLLSGVPDSTIKPLQTLQNSAARLIYKARRAQHCTPLLFSLHWLPVAQRIKYKVCCLCFKVVTNSAPLYLSQLLQVYSPSRTLRSSPDTRRFKVIRYKRKQHGFRSFAHFGPYIWNDLPLSVRNSQSLSSFKTNLKTHLFKEHFL